MKIKIEYKIIVVRKLFSVYVALFFNFISTSDKFIVTLRRIYNSLPYKCRKKLKNKLKCCEQ